ncbi:MAG: FkbM family methyltransferase [Clostridia bacterium]|nr:FkbM family methyltransferase [Clostridia bacterium]
MEHRDLWERLAAEGRDILLYGMGNGADKILAVLETRGVRVAGVFASDGFVRGQSFHGMRVQRYSEICTRYAPEECLILLAFGSARPEVIELIERVSARYEVLVPDVPVCGEVLFDADFYDTHRADLAQARALLADECSRQLFDRVIDCKLHGRLFDLLSATDGRDPLALLGADEIRSMADLGAYTGDSARELFGTRTPAFYLAAEPDRRSFKKLEQWADTLPCRVAECHNVAVFDREGELPFDASGNRNAGLCTRRAATTVRISTPDALLNSRAVDYIKYDVEGAEKEALLGSAATLRTHAPRLRVACYHRAQDLFVLPTLLARLAPAHDLYLTRARSLPVWDLDLIALPQ